LPARSKTAAIILPFLQWKDQEGGDRQRERNQRKGGSKKMENAGGEYADAGDKDPPRSIFG